MLRFWKPQNFVPTNISDFSVMLTINVCDPLGAEMLSFAVCVSLIVLLTTSLGVNSFLSVSFCCH